MPIPGCRPPDAPADSPMSLILVTSDRFANHLTPPGHPERPEREIGRAHV